MTPEVEAIGRIHFEGNVIPHSWYKNIKFDNGKADPISILLLSEILYWYRPTQIRDENTGAVIEVRKKFKADCLQKNKKALAEQFGLTERQVKDSLARLEKLGLITRDYRVVTVGDLRMANVLFIKIHPEKIAEISNPNCQTYDVQTSYPRRSNVTPPTLERQTNTYTTTKTTQENITPSKADVKKPPPLIKRKEHVQVSDEHHQKLIAKYGQSMTDRAYEFLNEWKESKLESDPKSLTKHTDYYRITKWVIKELQEQKLPPNTDNKDPEEVAKFRISVIKFIEKHRPLIKIKNLYVEDKVDHLRIGNDAIYYKDSNATELINHSLKKHDLIK